MSDSRAARFLRWLHDDQSGWAEIVAGQSNAKDPKKIDLVMSTRRFLFLDPEEPELYNQAVAYIDQLCASYGNVYTGIRLYSWSAKNENTRKESYTLPGRVIFIDDAPATPERPYSASVRTSKASRHAYYKCAQDVTKDDARRAAAALGGDPSGVDLTQLVRIPGTFNTKNGGRWSVASESTPGTIYNLDELRQRWPAGAAKVGTGIVTDLEWPEVEQWLGRAGALMDSQDIPRRFKPHQQSYRVLTGAVVPVNSQGIADESTRRAFIARGCAWARYPHDAAAAILWKHTSADYITRKGTEWHKGDIARIIAKEYAIVAAQVADYKIRPITAAELSHSKQAAPAQPIVSTPARSRARADRPRRFDPPMLFARYQAEPFLCDQRRKARASALSISTATLDRLEDGLEAIGLIQIEAKPGMPGRVILVGGVINIPQPEVLSGPIEAPPPEAPPARAVSGENVDRSPQCIGETHPPPETPGVWIHRPELAAWTVEAFDAYPGRASFRKVQKHVEMLADGRRFNLKTLQNLYADERDRRAWQRQITKLPTMKYSPLAKLGRRIERVLAAGADGPEAQFYKWADWYQPHVVAELDRRQDMKDRLRPGKRRGATVEEVLILAEIDDQRRQQPAQQQGTRGGVCSPQTTQSTIQPDLFSTAPAQSPYYAATLSLVERLKQAQP